MLRLAVALLVAAAVLSTVRWWWTHRRRALPPSFDLDRISPRAGRSPLMKEALVIRARVRDVLHQQRDAHTNDEIEAVLRLLAHQVDLHDRIAEALESLSDQRFETEVATLRLDKLRSHRDRLEERRKLLDTTSRQIVVDLNTLHLAILEATSTSVRRESASIDDARRALVQATEAWGDQAEADEEVRALLRDNGHEQAE